jgi:U4/U6.U5 tri-snRNP-associated protein 1
LAGDLVGLKVSHDFDKINEGDAKIFTLKDSGILDDEGSQYAYFHLVFQILISIIEDELQNIDMAADDEKMSKELKTKSRLYTGYDNDEFVAPGIPRSILAKYDEDIDGVQATGFRLGGAVTGSGSDVVRAERESDTGAVNKTLLSINYASEWLRLRSKM